MSRYIDNALPPSFRNDLSRLPPPRPRLLLGGARVPIPADHPADTTTIGRIRATAFLDSTRIAVLDDRLQVLRIFDADGRQEQSVGRSGQGPGEFGRPLALVRDSAGVLHVSDTERKIQRFVPAGWTYRYAGTQTLDLEAQSICFLHGSMVVQGVSAANQAILHRYGAGGSVLGSFGTLYRSPNLSLNEEFGYGLIACDEARGLVYYAPQAGVGEVRAYKDDGSVRWRTVFDGYRTNLIEDLPEMGYKVVAAAGGVHSLAALTLLPGSGLLVQWNYRTAKELAARESYGMIQNFLLDPDTGEPTYLGSDLPPILAVADSSVVVVFEDPAPRFEVRRFHMH